MTSIRKHIAVGTFSLSISSVIQRVISLFVFFTLVTQLSLHDYGTLVLLFSFVGPGVMAMTMGIGKLIQTEIAINRGEEKEPETRNLLKNYLISGISIFIVLAVLSFILRVMVLEQYGFFLLQFHIPFLLYLLGQYGVNMITIFMQGHEKFTKVSILGIAEPVFRLGGIFFILYFMNLDLMEAFVLYMLSKWFTVFVGVLLAAPQIKNILNQQKIYTNKLIELIKGAGKWMMTRNFLNEILRGVNPWLIKIFLSVEAIAIYDVAMRIYSILMRMFPFSTVLMAFIPRNIKNTGIITIVVHKVRKYFFLLSLFIIAGVWLAVDYVALSFLPQYMESAILLKIVIFKLWIDGMAMGQQGVLYAHRRQKFLFGLFLYGFFQKLLLSIVMLYYFDLIGLVLVLLVHSLVLVLIKSYYIKEKLNLLHFRIKDYLSFDFYDKMILREVIGSLKRFLSLRRQPK